MKRLTKLVTMSACLLLLLFMTNCQVDDNATVVNKSTTLAGTSRYITLKELALMPKAYQKFNSINSRSTTARGIYYQDYNFTINADLLLYYSDGKSESITFEVFSDKDNGYIENLVLNKEDNGEYSVYYILYDMSYQEKLLAADNNYVKIEKMSVQRLYDFDAAGMTNRNRSDIVMIGGDCFRRYYHMQRTDSFSGIPDQLEFSEVRGEEKFTPVPCPEPEVSLPFHPIMLPIFNPVPWNPDPIVPSPDPVIPGGATATLFAPIKTKTIINPQMLRFRNEPGFPQDLMDVYMNPDRMFGMRGRINSLIGSGKSDYDTKKDLAFRILNLAKDPENQQTALDLLDYMNENDYSPESIEFGFDVVTYLANSSSPESLQITNDMIDFMREFKNSEPEDAPALQMTKATYKNRYFEKPFDNNYYSAISPYCEVNAVGTEIWRVHFGVQCAILKFQHPEWSTIRVYYEASKEMIHLGLDLAGLVPVIGEVADLTNGVIYSIEGDGVNASLSFAATIPIAGWGSTAIKFANRTVDLANGSKTTLKWIKNTDNFITFGKRSQLRKVLGLAVGDARQAHHIIPWSEWNHLTIQKAAASKDAFHMSEAFNGIPLNTSVHSGSHQPYSDRIRQLLDDIPEDATPQEAYDGVMEILHNIKTAMYNNPNTHVNNLIF